jgi:hypothetical protein
MVTFVDAQSGLVLHGTDDHPHFLDITANVGGDLDLLEVRAVTMNGEILDHFQIDKLSGPPGIPASSRGSLALLAIVLLVMAQRLWLRARPGGARVLREGVPTP